MKKEFKIAGIVVLALVVIGLIIFASQKDGMSNLVNKSGDAPETMLEEQTPEAAKATQQLIDEVIGDEANVQTLQTSEPAAGEEGEEGTVEVKEVKAVIVSPGTSGINVETGEVVNKSGEAVANDAKASSQEAPQSSYPIEVEDLPSSAVKLEATMSSFTPDTFTVKRGQAVNLAISNVNETTFSEVFRFDDPSLKGVVVGVAKGETKSITFNAPDKAGEYTFYSSMFNHREQGAVGVMIVE